MPYFVPATPAALVFNQKAASGGKKRNRTFWATPFLKKKQDVPKEQGASEAVSTIAGA